MDQVDDNVHGGGRNRVKISLPRALARAGGLLGLVALAMGALLPWFTVPVTSQGDGDGIVAASTLLIWPFRATCLFTAVTALCWFSRGRGNELKIGTLLVSQMFVLLLFPYVLTVWAPSLSGEASWLQSQHESITGVTGDIYVSQEFNGSPLRQKIDVVNKPLDSGVISLPDWGTRSVGWGRLIDLSEWVGLSSWFSSFLRKGWVLAIAGTSAMLLAICRECEREFFSYLSRLLRRGLIIAGAGSFIAAVPVLGAIKLIGSARSNAQHGNYQGARNDLIKASWCVPVLREDGDYVLEKGLLDRALGADTIDARLYSAKLLDEQGLDAQAEQVYRECLEEQGSRGAAARESLRALLSKAIEAFNSGQMGEATALLTQVLEFDPCNLKANYTLQLAFLQQGEVAKLEELQKRMETVYRYFNTPTKEVVLANTQECLALAEFSRGNSEATLKMLRKVTRP